MKCKEKPQRRDSMSVSAEMSKMNEMAEKFNEMSAFEQQEFIGDVYVNVRRYTHHVFNKLGRPIRNSLQQDVLETIVQEVTLSLITTLKNSKFEVEKAKFSTILATYAKNRIYRQGYSERMAKRTGVLIPLTIQNEDGSEIEWLASDDNVEETVMESVEKLEKKQMVDNMISQFKPREQLIIRMRMQEKTLEEIGQAVGVTRERVRQILDNMFRQIRNKHKYNVG